MDQQVGPLDKLADHIYVSKLVGHCVGWPLGL